MRVPAAVAALPLLAGTATGVLLAESIPERFILASAAAAVFALIAGAGFLSLRFDLGVVVAVVIGCATAGLSGAVTSIRSLYAPPLLHWFHAHEDEAAEPLTLVGTLRHDAALADAVVSIVVDVGTVCAGSCDDGRGVSAPGGVRLSVGGAVPPDAVARWRAGRQLRLAALLRTPRPIETPAFPTTRRRSHVAGSPWWAR